MINKKIILKKNNSENNKKITKFERDKINPISIKLNKKNEKITKVFKGIYLVSMVLQKIKYFFKIIL